MTGRRLTALALLLMAACAMPSRAPVASPAGGPPALGIQANEAGEAKATPRAAVEALLEAEQRGDHDVSYRLLSPAARQDLPAPEDWARLRRDLPALTGFSIEAQRDRTVVAVVEHTPGLDPFAGLTPARERQTWTTAETAGGFLVEAGAVAEPLLPSDELAGPVARDWALAVQACDGDKKHQLEAVPILRGQSDNAERLCGMAGDVATGRAGKLAIGPAATDFQSQYGSDVVTWARAVPLSSPTPFHVVLAPLGDAWRVIGVFEP